MKTPPNLPLSGEESDNSPPDKGDTGGFLQVAISAAQAAGKIIREEYEKNHTGERKTDNTEVSQVDLAAEKAIIDIIHQNFPDHGIFSEEAGLQKTDSEYLWIIDPLDGSTNFLHHLGHFCTMVALIKGNEPVMGVIYIPLTNELFTNESKIKTSDTKDLKLSLMGYGRSSINTARHAKIYQALTPLIRSNRLLGSTGVHACYAADGKLDAFVCADCKLYDILAGAIIAKASGAQVTDFSGNPWQPDFSDPTSASDIVISNPHIHAELVAALQKV